MYIFRRYGARSGVSEFMKLRYHGEWNGRKATPVSGQPLCWKHLLSRVEDGFLKRIARCSERPKCLSVLGVEHSLLLGVRTQIQYMDTIHK